MNNELLQETYEVSAADKVLLDNIREMIDRGFDALIQRSPDSDHLTVRHYVRYYIDPDNVYENLANDIIKANKKGSKDFIINLNDNGYCIQPLDKFREQLNDIESILEDAVTKIEDIKDRFKEK